MGINFFVLPQFRYLVSGGIELYTRKFDTFRYKIVKLPYQKTLELALPQRTIVLP